LSLPGNSRYANDPAAAEIHIPVNEFGSESLPYLYLPGQSAAAGLGGWH
jgi:hypothetical protein